MAIMVQIKLCLQCDDAIQTDGCLAHVAMQFCLFHAIYSLLNSQILCPANYVYMVFSAASVLDSCIAFQEASRTVKRSGTVTERQEFVVMSALLWCPEHCIGISTCYAIATPLSYCSIMNGSALS